jgi:hypothetical protein
MIFEHQPNGTDSELSPDAADDWISNGWHWYFDVKSLRQKLPDTTLHMEWGRRVCAPFCSGRSCSWPVA